MRQVLALSIYAFVAASPGLLAVLFGLLLRANRPAAARRAMGVGAMLLVFGGAAFAAEGYMRLLYDEPQNPGSLASENWFDNHHGDASHFRGGCADEVRSGDLDPSQVEVVVVGDSFVWGLGVDPEETFSSLLQERTGANVLPAGKCSWSTDEQLRWTASWDRPTRLVVLSYFWNDIEDALKRTRTENAQLARRFSLGHRQIPLLGQSYVFDEIVFRHRASKYGGEYFDRMLERYDDDLLVAAHLKEIGRMLTWARGLGADVVFAVWPSLSPGQPQAYTQMEDRFLAKVEQAHEIDVVRLTPALEAAGIRDLETYRCGPLDSHPGPAGHVVAADVLEPYVLRAVGR